MTHKILDHIDDKCFNIELDGICHCPYKVPIIYIGMPKDTLKKIKSDKCQLCGGIISPQLPHNQIKTDKGYISTHLIVSNKVKGGIKNKYEIEKDRAKEKPKSRRLSRRSSY